MEMELMGSPGEAGHLWGASTVMCLDKDAFWVPELLLG